MAIGTMKTLLDEMLGSGNDKDFSFPVKTAPGSKKTYLNPVDYSRILGGGGGLFSSSSVGEALQQSLLGMLVNSMTPALYPELPPMIGDDVVTQEEYEDYIEWSEQNQQDIMDELGYDDSSEVPSTPQQQGLPGGYVEDTVPTLTLNTLPYYIADLDTSQSSDIRLKENIELVGSSPSGINIYEFDYKDKSYGEGRYKGVMAQEIPKASFRGSDGYLMVDYSGLDVKFERIR